MLFRCDGLDLSEAVNKVLKAVSSKTISPILEGIKISAYGDSVVLSGTDLELSITKTIKAEVIDEGQTVVPGKLFGEYLRKLTTEQISLELNERNQLRISYSDSEGFIQCMDVLEFPELKNVDKVEYFEVNRADLKSLINNVIFAVAVDDSRPILKGVLFEINENGMRAVALDGFRMAMANKKIISTTSNFSFIVPARSLSEISRMLDSDETVKIYVHSNNLMVDMNDTIITTRLLEGQFINYRQILNSNFNTTVNIKKSQLEDAIDRASLLSKGDKNSRVKFDITENSLVLTSDSEIGNVKENITVSMKGADITIAFNSKYFTDCLRATEDEYIKINFSNAISHCIVTPSENEDYLFLILPVRMV
ncbi:MAG: DNA polymerase III subunit beta [Clostridia bacterium]|nr:DNA polymerase III subunit beta [Clostridia bacterium]MBQ8522261.1 DNA polymerase III subunit beta [Clostridia bacterium]